MLPCPHTPVRETITQEITIKCVTEEVQSVMTMSSISVFSHIFFLAFEILYTLQRKYH